MGKKLNLVWSSSNPYYLNKKNDKKDGQPSSNTAVQTLPKTWQKPTATIVFNLVGLISVFSRNYLRPLFSSTLQVTRPNMADITIYTDLAEHFLLRYHLLFKNTSAYFYSFAELQEYLHFYFKDTISFTLFPYKNRNWYAEHQGKLFNDHPARLTHKINFNA